MSTAESSRVPLGAVMCRAGLLTEAQLEHALSVQESTGRPLGDVIIGLGYASPGAVANALAEQHGGTLRTEYGISAGLGKPKAPPEPVEHVLIVSGADGETLVRRDGRCPKVGETVVDSKGRPFEVVRVGLVPCAYLRAAP